MRLPYLILFLLLSCACSHIRPGLPEAPTDGSPLYLTGWSDGCETGATVYGNDYMRALYKTQVRSDMMTNQVYRNAWQLGNVYCRFYVSSYLMQGFVDAGFGRGIFDSNVLPAGENMRDPLWGNGEDADFYGGFNLFGWEMNEGLFISP